MRLRLLVLVAVLAGGLAVPVALAARHHHAGSRGLVIEVLSNRADLISGGEALVAVKLPSGVKPGSVRMRVGRRNVTSSFAKRQNGQYEGLLTGLRIGRNVVSASAPGHRTARTLIVNHSHGGPLFFGPQIKPWTCLNGSKGPKCHKRTTYTYQYKSSTTGQFASYNPKSPPSDVATTTTENGTKVPFIIRQETGYEDRDQYQISVLFQPKKPWTAWAPQKQFVHKLLITHGASCGIDHESGTAPSTTSDTVGVPGGPGASASPTTALGMGFAVMSTALDNTGHDCDLVTEAESLVMAKQHLIDHYGTLQFTIGTGCSGGSLAQQQIANAYPGVYQGIMPQCSFPDAWSTGQQLFDSHMTRGYFENPAEWGTGIVWTPNQIAAVEGHPNHGNTVIFDTTYWNPLFTPSNNCNGVPTKDDYNAKTNPRGVRCSAQDYMINVFGRRPASMWTPVEKKIGHGFAGRPIDNVGVEYGLAALQQGVITPAQFVDLNAKIGGTNIDNNKTSHRTAANRFALRADYRSGGINETNNLVNVAIIDLRGPDPGAFHDAYRSWTIRARLEHQEGHFPKNHVIWFGETPLIGDPNYTSEGLKAEDRWLSAVERDHRHISLEAKVADDRPANVHDRCSDITGVQQVSLPGVGPVCELPQAQTKFATPRIEAGESIATDIEKCKLEPLRQSSFYPITFTPAEWAALKHAFPTGVCDYTDRGVEQRDTVPWMTYQSDAAGHHVIYGGHPLGPAPTNSGEGWTSPAFDSWLSK